MADDVHSDWSARGIQDFVEQRMGRPPPMDPEREKRLLERQHATRQEHVQAKRRNRALSPAQKASRAASERALEAEGTIIRHASDESSQRLSAIQNSLRKGSVDMPSKRIEEIVNRVPESKEDAQARGQHSLYVAEQVARRLYDEGILSPSELRAVGRQIAQDTLKNMSGEEYAELREGPNWDAFEKILRYGPDNTDWQTVEKQQDVASRKVIGHALARAVLDGALPDSFALQKLRENLHVKDADDDHFGSKFWGKDVATLADAVVSIVDNDKNYESTVEYRKPDPVRPPEQIGDFDLKYSDRESRTNSPSSRERRRTTAFIDDVQEHGEEAFNRNRKMIERKEREAMGIVERRKSQPMPATGRVMNRHEAAADDGSLGGILNQALSAATGGEGGGDSGGGASGQPS
jgi:hypothetical protein